MVILILYIFFKTWDAGQGILRRDGTGNWTGRSYERERCKIYFLAFFFLFSSSSRIAHEHLPTYAFFFCKLYCIHCTYIVTRENVGFYYWGFLCCFVLFSLSSYIYPFVYSLFLINHFFSLSLSNVRYSWGLELAIHELTQHLMCLLCFFCVPGYSFSRIRRQRKKKEKKINISECTVHTPVQSSTF